MGAIAAKTTISLMGYDRSSHGGELVTRSNGHGSVKLSRAQAADSLTALGCNETEIARQLDGIG